MRSPLRCAEIYRNATLNRQSIDHTRGIIYADCDLCNQSHTGRKRRTRLRTMGVKYYTHFVLTSAEHGEAEQEFSGVVEVSKATDEMYERADIEALLARNFDFQVGDLRLINWARLQ